MSIQSLFPNTQAILQLLGGQNLLGNAQQQSNTDPLLALLGQTNTTNNTNDLLAQLLGLGTVPTGTTAPSNTETITLPTYDVNFIRQLADDASVGGNGDGVMRKAELQNAANLLNQLNQMFGNVANATFKSLVKTANLLLRDDIAKAISGKDGLAADISARDIVLTAQGDADKKLETIQVVVPKAATTPVKNELDILELLKKLFGQV